MHEQLGRIEGKLDIIVPLAQDNAQRLTKVERKVNIGHGIVVTLTTLLAAIGALFTDW